MLARNRPPRSGGRKSLNSLPPAFGRRFRAPTSARGHFFFRRADLSPQSTALELLSRELSALCTARSNAWREHGPARLLENIEKQKRRGELHDQTSGMAHYDGRLTE